MNLIEALEGLIEEWENQVVNAEKDNLQDDWYDGWLVATKNKLADLKEIVDSFKEI